MTVSVSIDRFIMKYLYRALVDYMSENFCLDRSSVHQSGVSNGGMFSYFMASQLSDIFASIGIVLCASIGEFV